MFALVQDIKRPCYESQAISKKRYQITCAVTIFLNYVIYKLALSLRAREETMAKLRMTSCAPKLIRSQQSRNTMDQNNRVLLIDLYVTFVSKNTVPQLNN